MTDQRHTRGTVADRKNRHADTPRWAWWALAALVAAFLAAGFAGLAVVKVRGAAQENRTTLAKINRESLERRDQICLSAEREHLGKVNQLRRTYRYLAELSPRESRSTFNKFILKNLPMTEAEANTDQAPDFCDEPGVKAERLWLRSHGKQGAPPVGLPEPDPVVPQRPAGIPPTR